MRLSSVIWGLHQYGRRLDPDRTGGVVVEQKGARERTPRRSAADRRPQRFRLYPKLRPGCVRGNLDRRLAAVAEAWVRCPGRAVGVGMAPVSRRGRTSSSARQTSNLGRRQLATRPRHPQTTRRQTVSRICAAPSCFDDGHHRGCCARASARNPRASCVGTVLGGHPPLP